MRAVDSGKLPDDVRHEVVRRGALHPQDSVRGLFERFIPANERPKRLGTRIDPAEIRYSFWAYGLLAFYIAKGVVIILLLRRREESTAWFRRRR